MPIIKLGGLQKFYHQKQWASELPTLRTTDLKYGYPTLLEGVTSPEYPANTKTADNKGPLFMVFLNFKIQ